MSRGVFALVVAFIAVGVGNPWLGVPLGVFALSLGIGALTGYCPPQLLQAILSSRTERASDAGRSGAAPSAVLGFPVALQDIDVR